MTHETDWMMDDGYIIGFGKHKGKTLREVREEDFGYLFWLNSEANISDDVLRKAVYRMVREINQKRLKEAKQEHSDEE